MKTPQDISKDPDMIELERMIEAGELDPDRVTRYADEEPEENSKKLYRKLSPQATATFRQALKDILSKTTLKSAGVRPDEACGGIPEEYKLNNSENTRNNTEEKEQSDNNVKPTKNL